MIFTKYCYVLLTLFFPVFDRQPEYADHQMMSRRNIHIMTVEIDFVTSAKKKSDDIKRENGAGKRVIYYTIICIYLHR